MTTLGKTVAEFLTPVIEGIHKFVDWLNSLDAGTRKVIVTIGAIVAAAGPVLITVGKMAQGVGALMKLAPNIVTAFGKETQWTRCLRREDEPVMSDMADGSARREPRYTEKGG